MSVEKLERILPEKGSSASDAGVWWQREDLALWLPPLSADDPELLTILHEANSGRQ